MQYKNFQKQSSDFAKKCTALYCKFSQVVVPNWSTMGQKVDSHGSQSGPKVDQNRIGTLCVPPSAWLRSGPKVALEWTRSGPRSGPIGGLWWALKWAEPHRKSRHIFGGQRSISGLAFWGIGPYNEGIHIYNRRYRRTVGRDHERMVRQL